MQTVQFQNVRTVRTQELKFLCAYVGTQIPHIIGSAWRYIFAEKLLNMGFVLTVADIDTGSRRARKTNGED